MAANKPTAVHFSLIIFVMLFIITTVVAYMKMNEARELRVQLTDAKDDQQKQKNEALNSTKEVNALKSKIGYADSEVGVQDPTQPETVLHKMNEDIKNYSLTTPENYTIALREVREALQTARDNYSKEQATTRQLNETIATLKDSYDDKVRTAEAERAAAVQARMDAEKEHSQALAAKQQEYDDLNSEHQKLKVAMRNAQDAHEEAIAQKEDRISDLVSINNILQDRIKNATRTSFERPDGLVRWVDNSTHMVWINLGSADNLTKRTSFSVYRQGNRGVGVDSKATAKGPEDMKGAIEVTKILGPHMAEARIIDEDYYNPIAEGDPVYTPIWSPNQKESFAFVGKIDLDDDGRSDRELLHDLLASANANVQIEVDDEGNRTGGKINERTKFLVVGELPSLEELADEEDKDQAMKVLEEHKALKDEARLQGVRVVTLNDFLAFIGYTPRQRVFRPGDQRPFALRNGSRSTATSETVGRNRVSSGQTSGLYSRSKRLRQPTSTGQTSGAYGGSR